MRTRPTGAARPLRHRRASGARVLDAWAASPARFREDANAEEDLVRGGYRDRLLVELAQNAADAAARAGVPGRLRLELAGGRRCRAANTGAPLDAAGVQGLATLRASAKRDEAAQRRPVRRRLRRGPGGQRRARRRVGDRRRAVQRRRGRGPRSPRVPALAAELARRDGAVPVLRLPWPADGAVARRASPPRWCCRCGPAPATAVAAALAGAVGRAAARAARPGRRRGRRRRGRPARWRSSGPTAAPGSPTAGATTVWQVAQRSGELPAELRRRPAGRGAGPPRLDGDLGGAAGRRRPSRARCPPGRSCTRRRRATSRCRCRCG